VPAGAAPGLPDDSGGADHQLRSASLPARVIPPSLTLPAVE